MNFAQAIHVSKGKSAFQKISQKRNAPLCHFRESIKGWLCFLSFIEIRLTIYTSSLRLISDTAVFNGTQWPMLICWQAVALMRYLRSFRISRCYRQPRLSDFEVLSCTLVLTGPSILLTISHVYAIRQFHLRLLQAHLPTPPSMNNISGTYWTRTWYEMADLLG